MSDEAVVERTAQRSLERVVHRRFDAQKELCERSMPHFIRQAWPAIEPGRTFVPNWHIDAIGEHLQAVMLRQIRRLIINIPPRHMKSISTVVMLPSWTWIPRPISGSDLHADGHDPHHKFLCGSYALSLAIRDQQKTKAVCQSEWYLAQWPDNFADGNTRVLHTRQGGERIVTAVDAGATGQGGDTIIIDDPHNVQEVTSDAMRGAALTWIDQVMSTRLNDPKTGSIIVIMQRSHESDATGHLLGIGGWTHLMLPTEYEAKRKCVIEVTRFKDPRTKEGALLWPTRYGVPEVAGIKRELGSYGFAGQHQQRPSPEGGGIVRREWFEKAYVRRNMLPQKFDFICLSLDAAFKDSDTSSYVCGQVWGCVGIKRYRLGQFRDRMSFTATLDALAAYTKNERGDYILDQDGRRQLVGGLVHRWPDYNVMLIEDKANGTAIIDSTRKHLHGVVEYEPSGSKIARAQAVAPQIEAGDVHCIHPDDDPTTEPFVAEWCGLPNSTFMDQVDAASQALDYSRRIGLPLAPNTASVGETMRTHQEYLDGVAQPSGLTSGRAKLRSATKPWDS